MSMLTPIEKQLKDLSGLYPDSFNSTSVDLSDIKPLINKLKSINSIQTNVLFENDLTEEQFFPIGQDTMVIPHLRFLPPVQHSHYFFEVIAVTKGNCTNTICGNTIELQTGDFCVIAPRTPHSLRVMSENTNVLNILIRTSTFASSFQPLFLDSDVLSIFFSHTLFGKSDASYLIFRTDLDPDIMNFMGFLEKESSENYRYKGRMMNTLFQSLAIMLLRKHDNHVILPLTNAGQDSILLTKMISYIMQNNANVSLTSLSQYCGYSERHTSRLIHEYSGKTFSNFVRSCKLLKASTYLSNTDITIEQIAEVLGYNELSSFHRAFKKEFGMPPAEYRQNMKTPQTY